MPKRKSILVVGVGSIGERHVRCFQATGRADVSICEINPVLRAACAERHRLKDAFADLEAALESKPDAAIICTPAHTHITLALSVVDKGIHVFIEKPLSTKLEGIKTLQEKIRERSLVAGVAYVYRAHPVLTAMRETILSRRFGEPIQIVGVFGQNFPFFRPAYRETYYRDHVTGGGAVQDALTHVINAGEWLVGPVTSLVADGAHQVLPGVAVEDTVHVLTRHDAVLGSYSLNQYQAPNEGTFTVACEEGTARFEYHKNRWGWQTQPDDDWHHEPATPLERDTLFTRQAESLLDAIEGKQTPLCNLEEGMQTLRVNLGILRSIQERQWQTL